METYYIAEKTKIKISSFVYDILRHDARIFGFIKSNDDPNINGLLNKLIPILLEIKKFERANLLKAAEQFGISNAETLCQFADMLFDDIYFSDAELNRLENYIWIRPNENTRAVFDEIVKSELPNAAVELSVYLRHLLNRYARMPEYKREAIAFDGELEIFDLACRMGHIAHFRYEGKIRTVFAYSYFYGYALNQRNYLVCFDIENKLICSFPLIEVSKIKITRKPFHPSNKLIDAIDKYCQDCMFDETLKFEEDI